LRLTANADPGIARRWFLGACLLGGTADGLTIQLESLIPEIAVDLIDGFTIAVTSAAAGLDEAVRAL
jgi:hypothetical protein